jgi:hypothetical protein
MVKRMCSSGEGWTSTFAESCFLQSPILIVQPHLSQWTILELVDCRTFLEQLVQQIDDSTFWTKAISDTVIVLRKSVWMSSFWTETFWMFSSTIAVITDCIVLPSFFTPDHMRTWRFSIEKTLPLSTRGILSSHMSTWIDPVVSAKVHWTSFNCFASTTVVSPTWTAFAKIDTFSHSSPDSRISYIDEIFEVCLAPGTETNSHLAVQWQLLSFRWLSPFCRLMFS